MHKITEEAIEKTRLNMEHNIREIERLLVLDYKTYKEMFGETFPSMFNDNGKYICMEEKEDLFE